MNKIIRSKRFSIVWLIIALILILSARYIFQSNTPFSGKALPNASPFVYSFNSSPERLYEAGNMHESTSPYWWVNSGGYMSIDQGTGNTVAGSLALNDPWRIEYAKANPLDTDEGYHPQNIFRLVSKSTWNNFQEEIYFRINNNELSSSPNRNESNGLLLFLRYVDSANLYYAGIRVDGTAVIKKKLKGVYYTLNQVPIFTEGKYDPIRNPNLLPLHTWIGERVIIQTLDSGEVSIQFYIDNGETGNWKLIAEAMDDGKINKTPIKSGGYVGVRTDFMDVSFKNFKVEQI